MELSHSFILALALQSIFIAVLFIFRKSHTRYANILLAFFLFATAWMLIFTVVFWSQLLYTPQYVHSFFTYYIPLSTFAPLFFFYIRKIVTDKSISLNKDFWHFIPLLYVIIGIVPFFFLSRESKMDLVLLGQSREYAYLLFPYGYLDAALILIMIAYGVTIFYKYWKVYKGNRDLRIWTRAIILAFLGCVLSFTLNLTFYFLGLVSPEQDFVVIVFLSAFSLVISYFAFNYSAIFNGTPIEDVLPFVKYKKTGLSKNYSLELKSKLENLMTNDKPYLNSELRLDNLAELLGISRHHASQIINEYFKSNYFDFINSYRVVEAIELLEVKKKEITLSEVGYLSGFNNTVSFNKAFKKNTGMTPSKFRELLLDADKTYK
ncbi:MULTISPECIES: helix-turn-helix domain-containing protein [Flavobacteriaceae]|uniref:helix-turn-helix domain-containing protein n=1 Tax=Flavobacteriaceae TaxID=49546 RepID=UPI0014924046|nr:MULTISPECIES: helix-turn-helix domain-containing protein [Allomuricauda]MDC6366699.1 helix-turn-helix domain-containing protein [Muricauda sp. AC10]